MQGHATARRCSHTHRNIHRSHPPRLVAVQRQRGGGYAHQIATHRANRTHPEGAGDTRERTSVLYCTSTRARGPANGLTETQTADTADDSATDACTVDASAAVTCTVVVTAFTRIHPPRTGRSYVSPLSTHTDACPSAVAEAVKATDTASTSALLVALTVVLWSSLRFISATTSSSSIPSKFSNQV